MIDVQFLHQKVASPMRLEELSQEQRKKIFSELSGYVNDFYKVKYTEQVRMLSEVMPSFNYSRIKNLRSELKTFPKVSEIRVYMRVFKKELQDFESEFIDIETQQPSETAKRLSDLEERMDRMEQMYVDKFNVEKELLLNQIKRLKKEFNNKNK